MLRIGEGKKRVNCLYIRERPKGATYISTRGDPKP